MRFLVLLAFVLACGKDSGDSEKAKALTRAEVDKATMMTKKYAFEGYPSWAVAHPDKACPAKIDELNEYVNSKDAKDPWGNDYVMYCGPTLPKEAKGLAISSNGPDGKPNTPDDIQSWKL